jgi:hypothetical protein
MFDHFESEKEKKKALTRDDKKKSDLCLAWYMGWADALSGLRKIKMSWKSHIYLLWWMAGRRRRVTLELNLQACLGVEGNIQEKVH